MTSWYESLWNLVSITGLWLCTLKKPEPENQPEVKCCLSTPVYHAVCQPVNRVERPGNIPTASQHHLHIFTIKGTVSLHPTQQLDYFHNQRNSVAASHTTIGLFHNQRNSVIASQKNATCTFSTVKQCHCIGNTSLLRHRVELDRMFIQQL